ncbi:SWIM zinc finger family protein [Halomicrococcus sp. NG-SE-24]|uniref:SWIM zinc finger family protein n=1 Tax=Halomicrococcus sp. NG-SE-24 TaxID=3436928 RepID=UPI003D96FC63
MSNPDNPLSKLEFTKRTAKRAQYEAFEFTVLPGGVRVRNTSHANPRNHEYHVTVEDGVPSACECPADDHYDGACKHRVAVAIRVPVLRAAIDQQVAADGGTQEDADELEEATEDACDCSDLDGFPCWECVRTGRKDLPDDTT